MKSILVIFVLFNIILKIKCQFAIPEEYHDVKDAIESDYYKETLEHFFKDEEIPLIPRGGRIAGGEKAIIGQFPYYALLYLSDEEGRRYVCGGVLVKYNWILTVSHFCLLLKLFFNSMKFNGRQHIALKDSHKLKYFWEL